MMLKPVLLLSLMVSHSWADSITVTDPNFSQPEAIEHFRGEDVYLVTHSNGNRFSKDNNGFISRVSPDGQVQQAKWIVGGVAGVRLDAPKAMVIVEENLYVTDIDKVRVFSLRTRLQQADIPIPGSTHLTGISTLPSGDLLVVDSGESHGNTPTGTDALYRINAYGEVFKLHQDAQWGTPTCVSSNNDNQIFTLTYGSGQMFQLNRDGEIEQVNTLPSVFLQGLESDNQGNWLISSSGLGRIYRLNQQGEFSEFIDQLKQPMDLAVDRDRHRLLIPQQGNNSLLFVDLEP